MIVIIASIIVISAVIVGVLTYNGVFSDKDNDGIPDKVEEAVADVKEDIKELVFNYAYDYGLSFCIFLFNIALGIFPIFGNLY